MGADDDVDESGAADAAAATPLNQTLQNPEAAPPGFMSASIQQLEFHHIHMSDPYPAQGALQFESSTFDEVGGSSFPHQQSVEAAVANVR